jgi:hypothetical protein
MNKALMVRFGMVAVGMVAGYKLVPGTSRERMYTSVIGGAAGYLLGMPVTAMLMPPTPEVAPTTGGPTA